MHQPGVVRGAMEADVSGVSTRSVDDLVAALGIGSGISKSESSSICSELDTAITATGQREVLGVDVGDSEDEVFWRGFHRSLKNR